MAAVTLTVRQADKADRGASRNARAPSDVIIIVMRTHKTWINMVAMLALLMGFVPTSAVASLFASSCKMTCCVGKPTHKMADPVCLKGCEADKGHKSKPATSVQERQSDDCKCSISSAPTKPRPDVAAPAASGLQIHQVIADIPAEKQVIVVASEPESEPGIFGTDSGPPISGPNYVSLGRAPPVHLA